MHRLGIIPNQPQPTINSASYSSICAEWVVCIFTLQIDPINSLQREPRSGRRFANHLFFASFFLTNQVPAVNVVCLPSCTAAPKNLAHIQFEMDHCMDTTVDGRNPAPPGT